MKRIVCAVIIAVMMLTVTACTPQLVEKYNHWIYSLNKTNDATNYQVLKKVEDTCRAMISSYESDKLTYEQYKDSDNEEKQSWAEQAKMRANKTAATYNNYILENSFVWSGNVPEDITKKLDYIE